MKKMFLFLLGFIPFILFAQKGNYTIKGTIAWQLPANAKVILKVHDQINEASIINGSFNITGEVPFPSTGSLYLKNDSATKQIKLLDLYLINGNATITINNVDEPELTTVSGDDNFTIFHNQLYLPLTKLENQYLTFIAAGEKDKALNALKGEFKIAENFIQINPSSALSLKAWTMILYHREALSVSELEQWFNAMSPEVKESPKGKAYGQEMQRIMDKQKGQQ